MSKLGILGGTFNPIHFGHIEMAEAARRELDLDKVLLIPGGNPPHKEGAEITDADVRYEMTSKSAEVKEGIEVCDYEIKKQGFSYTAETLEYLKKSNPGNEFYFILGADSLDYIENWHRPETIFKLAKLVVFDRGNFDSRKKADSLLEKFGGQIIYIDEDIPDISSTEIREMADMGLDISELVPKEAVKIIEENGLYRGYYTELREKVQAVLHSDRFMHTEGVIKLAVKLAEIYGADRKKAYLAALLHDAAKNIPKEEMLRLCDKNGVELDEFERTHPPLIHAKLGAYLAKTEYKIDDEEIIDAIRWHTLGRIGMSDLEKIIFVADMAEEGRSFPGVELIRAEAMRDLDGAVKLCVEQTIRYNEKKGVEVHENAYRLAEYYTGK